MKSKDKKDFKKFFDQNNETSDKIENLLKNLRDDLIDYSKVPFSFNDFIFQLNRRPQIVLRNVYNIFSDMVWHYVKRLPPDKNASKSAFLKYDMNKLFVDDTENPFYSDMIFSAHFMEMVNSISKGVQTNRIYLFEGPPGSGKSTFLNNLLNKLEEYTQMPEGIMLKTVWHFDTEKLSRKKSDFWDRIELIAQKYDNQKMIELVNQQRNDSMTEKYFDISCPYNDHPILQIPKEYRKQFLDTVIEDKSFKNKLFEDKKYSWIFKEEACHFCSSVYDQLYDILKDPSEIMKMIYAKMFSFSRKFGRGISIYNPADEIFTGEKQNLHIQNKIQEIFKNDEVKYIFSPMAYTNNGVYAIMDLKGNNIQRFKNLHSIISDGVHKVDVREERINTLFIGLINPEDKKHFAGIKSFQDRIVTVPIPYVLDYKTEKKIIKYKFGNIEKFFMPEVLNSFCKIIVSSRLDKKNSILKNWINTNNYKFLDSNLLLLKMEIFSGNMPNWLLDKDKTILNNKAINEIKDLSKTDGQSGISGRQMLSLFNKFFTKYFVKNKLLTIDNVLDFFDNQIDNETRLLIPPNFTKSILKYYNFIILQQVKEAIYYYNRNEISRDIINYLCAINFEIGQEIKCPYTNDKFVVDSEKLKNFEAIFLGTISNEQERLRFRQKQLKEYISTTLAQEIKVFNKKITQTNQFRKLFIDYTTNLKQNALIPYIDNLNFRQAVIDFGTKNFEKYDNRLKNDVQRLIKNLKHKFKYTTASARDAILYVIDNKLH